MAFSLQNILNVQNLGVRCSGDIQSNGATWNETADSYTTIGRAPYYVHEAMQPVLVTPGAEGTSDIVLVKTDYSKRDDTGATVGLDGSQGQVMMRIPKFWYRYNYTSPTHQWEVSPVEKMGFTLHPAFVKSGVEVPYRYIGVYQATWYDVSLGVYVDGDGTNTAFDTSADKLGSIVGKKPLSSKTRAQFRAAAARVGTGWQLMDFWLYSALKMLYITRYGNLNSQSVLGTGNTQFSSWNFAACISATGKVKSINATGQSTAGGNSGDYVNFLGIEDIFGGIWQWVDGWNTNNGVNYICSTPANFADDTTTNYALFGGTNPTTSGWQNTLQQNIGLLPATIGATSATKVTDYYYYNTGWRAPYVGGSASSGSNCGLFYLAADDSSSTAYSFIGSRLCF